MMSRIRWVWAASLVVIPAGLTAAGTVAQTKTKKVDLVTDHVLDVRVSPDGKRVVGGGFGKVIQVWDLKSGDEVKALGGVAGPTKTTRAVAFSPDGTRVAAGGDDGIVRVWEVGTGKAALVWDGHEEMINSVVFSPDGKYLAAASGTPENGGETWRTKVRLWDLVTGKLGRDLEAGLGKLAFSPDSKLLAVADGRVRLWDITTGKVVRTLAPDLGTVGVVAFSGDGKTVAGGGGYQVAHGAGTVNIARAWLWDAESGKLRRTFDDLNTYLRAIAVSADGTRLATGCTGKPKSDGSLTWVPSEVKLLDTATGKELWVLHGSPGDCGAVAFSPDGTTIVYCDGGGVRLVGVATGEVTKVLTTTTTRPRQE